MNSRTMSVAVISLLLIAAMLHADSAPQPARRYLKPEGDFVFSNGVQVGNTLYVAGHLGLDPKTGKPPATPEEEAKLVLDAFKTTLARADMTMDDLVQVTVYCPDVALWQKFNGVYRGYFGKDFPARAFIGSGPLLFGARFEVQGIAVKR
ncbi:MAG: RidA family protein [Terriglobales bacterium]